MKLVNGGRIRVLGTTFCCVAVLAGATAARSRADASRDREPTPLLWRDPGNVAEKNVYWGSGNSQRAPQPPFRFVKEDTGGTKPKVHVVDERGEAWNVKFDHDSSTGREVPAEIAAGRIMWALGYLVEESYLVSDGVIEQIGPLKRAREVIGPDGRFATARFERRPTDVERLSKQWSLDDNPFARSPELSGLVVVVALLNNWDFRPGNTVVLRVNADTGPEDWYVVSDLGTAFGRMSGGIFRSPSRWNLKHYERDTAFIACADEAILELHYRPDGRGRARVPVAHARWLSRLTTQLTASQIQQAFRAAGASDDEVRGFSARLMAKLAELHDSVGNGRLPRLQPGPARRRCPSEQPPT